MTKSGGNSTLSETDLSIIAELSGYPRAPLAGIAGRVGLHERTVARRVDRLVEQGLIRFTAALVPEYLGEGVVADLALRCAPGHLRETALALAQRRDSRSVAVASGSADVFAEVWSPDPQRLMDLIDGDIAGLAGVLEVRSLMMLELLMTAEDWHPGADPPEPPETRAARITARRTAGTGHAPASVVAHIDEMDRRLVAALRRDARMPTTRLAAELRVGEATARRRLARLMRSRALHLRLHVEPAVLGYRLETRFCLLVTNRHLDRALEVIAADPAVRQLDVTGGATNVLGYASHRTMDEVRAFGTEALAAVPGLVSAETAVLLHSYKRAGVVTLPPNPPWRSAAGYRQAPRPSGTADPRSRGNPGG